MPLKNFHEISGLGPGNQAGHIFHVIVTGGRGPDRKPIAAGQLTGNPAAVTIISGAEIFNNGHGNRVDALQRIHRLHVPVVEFYTDLFGIELAQTDFSHDFEVITDAKRSFSRLDRPPDADVFPHAVQPLFLERQIASFPAVFL